MKEYSKLDIVMIFGSCKNFEEIEETCLTFKWLWALGDNYSLQFITKVSQKRLENLYSI